MNCPNCGSPLTGLGTKCWAGGDGCGWSKGKPTRNETQIESSAPDTEPRRIVIPWGELVSVNKRKGGLVGKLSEEYREKLGLMRDRVSKVVQDSRWGVLTGPVRLDVEFHVPDKRRRDCSNYMKALEDSMTGTVYEDDSQVVEWHGFKMPVSPDPRAVVTVTAIAREQAA